MKNLFKFDFKTRHAGVSSLITIAVLAGVIIINILMGKITLQADLTPRKLYSLTDETRALLDRLETEVEIIALFGVGAEPEGIMETVNEYQRLSPNISITSVDPDREPGLLARFAKEDQPIPASGFIVSSGSHYRVITTGDLYDFSYGQQGQPQVTGQKVEQQFTAALAYVSSGRMPKIYEVVGHNETTLAQLGYSTMLAQANYKLEDTSLTLSDIPPDAELLTLIGPRSDLSPAEAAKLNAYLDGGGRIFVALDLPAKPFENVYALLRNWDIDVRHGVVLETQQSRLIAEFGDNPFVFAPHLQDHEILKPLTESKLNPVFQTSLGFQRTATEQRRLEYFSLLHSSESSRLRTNLAVENPAQVNPITGDEAGPIDIAVAVRQRNMETYDPEGAVVLALGSASTLGGLGFLGQLKANADLVMNAINWIVDDGASVNVASKSLFRLPLQINTVVAIIYAAVAILVIPLLCLGAGLFIWMRRRHR